MSKALLWLTGACRSLAIPRLSLAFLVVNEFLWLNRRLPLPGHSPAFPGFPPAFPRLSPGLFPAFAFKFVVKQCPSSPSVAWQLAERGAIACSAWRYSLLSVAL